MPLKNLKPTCTKNKCSYVLMLEKKIKELEKENERLKKDPLTGVWNRHYLNELLQKEYLPRIEEGWFFNIYMVDIDDLHNYNRKYGYIEGDKYIKNIIDNIKKAMEEQNIKGHIFRTGGDEFLIFYQPYDKLNLNNIENITYAHTIFDFQKLFKDVINELDSKIIKIKKGKNVKRIY